MINGKYLARRTIAHIIHSIEEMQGLSDSRKRQHIDGIRGVSENCDRISNIDFEFNVSKDKCLDVMVFPEKREGFDEHIANIQEKEFWKDPSLDYLKKQRRIYQKYLENFEIEKNSGGNYHFKAKINTNNKDDAFFAVLFYVVKPACLYRTKQ